MLSLFCVLNPLFQSLFKAVDMYQKASIGLALGHYVDVHHHHYVPSVVNRSAVMDLHRSRS